MTDGIKIILAIICVTLMIIAEKGVPVKFTKGDWVIYIFLLCTFSYIALH